MHDHDPDRDEDLIPPFPPIQLAERWHVTPEHLANLRAQGKGPVYIKPTGRVLYRFRDIVAYENARAVEPIEVAA